MTEIVDSVAGVILAELKRQAERRAGYVGDLDAEWVTIDGDFDLRLVAERAIEAMRELAASPAR